MDGLGTNSMCGSNLNKKLKKEVKIKIPSKINKIKNKLAKSKMLKNLELLPKNSNKSKEKLVRKSINFVLNIL